MPFKSKAQIRKFARDPKLRQYLQEWLDATPNIESLPEKVGSDMTIDRVIFINRVLDKDAECGYKKTEPHKSTGKSLTKLEREMNDKAASAGEKALMGALGVGGAGIGIYELISLIKKMKDSASSSDDSGTKIENLTGKPPKEDYSFEEKEAAHPILSGLVGAGGAGLGLYGITKLLAYGLNKDDNGKQAPTAKPQSTWYTDYTKDNRSKKYSDTELDLMMSSPKYYHMNKADLSKAVEDELFKQELEKVK